MQKINYKNETFSFFNPVSIPLYIYIHHRVLRPSPLLLLPYFSIYIDICIYINFVFVLKTIKIFNNMYIYTYLKTIYVY